MDAIRKLAILLVAIVLVVVLGPVALRFAHPSWGFNRDLERGTIRWRPIYGVLVERQLGENLFEQYIVDWIGPGTIQVVQYVNSADSELFPENGGGGRQRVGTEEMRVTINLGRLYSIARSPDEFPVVIRQKFEAEVEKGPFASGGKLIATDYGDVYFGPFAAVMLEKPYRWGFKTLAAGEMMYLSGKKWTTVDPGDLDVVGELPAGSFAGFAVLKNVRLTRGMAPADRIETLKGLLWQMAGGAPEEFPADADGTTLEFARSPDDAALVRGIQRLMYTNDWVFPLADEVDIKENVGQDTLDGGGVIGAIAIGYGYSLPKELVPSTESMWFLRCLEQTEIAVPYSAPF